jgi:hypothetical protein
LNLTEATTKCATKLSVKNAFLQMNKHHLLSSLCACAVALTATAQSADNNDDEGTTDKPLRPVISAYTVEAGSSHIADTYLTPLRYAGWHLALHYERMQAMAFNPKDWVMQLDVQINGDRATHYKNGPEMWYADVNARWGMMRRWTPASSLTVGIGPSTEVILGAMYLRRNGNNPVAAKGAWTVNASGYAAYHTKLLRIPVTLRYEAVLPSAGIFFAPDYGELYYEIWLGNHSNLVHPAWWGNYFRLDNYLTADLHFGGTTLRLGYHNDILSTKVAGVVSERVTHAFTIGVTTEWLSLSPRRKHIDTQNTISALY